MKTAKGWLQGYNAQAVATTDQFVVAAEVTNIAMDAPAYALMVGVPARQIGWMSRFGEQLDLPLEGSGEATCPNTGEQYHLTDGQLTRCAETS